MKRYLCLTLALLISSPLSAAGGDLGLRGNLLTPFLHVLQAGNIVAIEALLGGDLLKETQVLLRQNKTYPQFLRHYYQGATFEVGQVSAEAGEGFAEVTIVFPDGQRQPMLLRLAQKHPNGPWKIVDFQSQGLNP